MPSNKRTVNVRFDNEMFEAIDSLSEFYGISRSEVIRRAIKQDLKLAQRTKQSREHLINTRLNIAKLMQQIGCLEAETNRIGNNINQIAKRVNTNGKEPVLEVLKEYKNELRKINDNLKTIAENYNTVW